MLQVEILGAQDLINVDTDGTVSDPFAMVTCGGNSQQTLVMENTLSPAWNETFYFPAAGPLNIKVMDGATSLGQAQLPPPTEMGVRKEIALPLAGVRSGRISLAVTLLDKLPEEEEVVDRDVEEEGEEVIECEVKEEEAQEFNPLRVARGAVFAPTRYEGVTLPLTAPEEKLRLTQVQGYRGNDCRRNAWGLPDGSVAYHIAATCIVMNPATRDQRFLTEHTDDILCLTANAQGTLCASAQIGKEPFILLWDPRTMRVTQKLMAPAPHGHTAGINVVAFSDDGTRLASVGVDDDHKCALWDVATGRLLGAVSGGKNKLLDAQFTPGSNTEFTAVGVKALVALSFAGGRLTAGKGLFGTKVPIDTLLGVQHMQGGMLATPTASGAIYLWRGRSLSTSKPAHQGRSEAICPLPGGGILTGGADGTILGWAGSAMKKCCECRVGEGVRSLHIQGNRLVVGTKNNTLMQFGFDPATLTVLSAPGLPPATPLAAPAGPAPRPGGIPAKPAAAAPPAVVAVRANPIILTVGHVGEVWGLATHPQDSNLVYTCGDDKTLRLWNLESRRMERMAQLGAPARTVAVSPDAQLVAVGRMDGHIELLRAADLSCIKTIQAGAGKDLSVVKFSPDGSRLAAGGQAMLIEVFAVPALNLVGRCKGHTSRVSSLDWSTDSQVMQSNSSDYALLHWDAASGRQITHSSSQRDTEWASHTIKIGWPVLGVWPERRIPCDGSDINAIDVNPARTLIAFGDDFRQVEVCRFPCVDKLSQKDCYRGHSEHVTSVRFTADGSRVLSIGGLDAAVMEWTLV